MRYQKILFILLLLFGSFSSFIVFSKNNSKQRDTITLIVSGEGITKDEATKVALRSAIEQAFGTFVSSNIEIINDEIIKEEIATVSSGNIQSYKELSYVDLGDTKLINIEAIVSIGKLRSFVKSRGMSAELAGETFAMNIKVKELNRKNELKALENMFYQLTEIAKEFNLFDYKLEISEPQQFKNEFYGVELAVEVIPNENALNFFDLYFNTLKSLSISKKERKEYDNMGLNYYPYYVRGIGIIYLRNEIPYYESDYVLVQLDFWDKKKSSVTLFDRRIRYLLIHEISNFIIQDNLNNQVSIKDSQTNLHPRSWNYWNEGGEFVKLTTKDDLSLAPVSSFREVNKIFTYYDRGHTLSCIPSNKNFDCEMIYGVPYGFYKYAKEYSKWEKFLEFNLRLLYPLDIISKISSIEIKPVINDDLED